MKLLRSFQGISLVCILALAFVSCPTPVTQPIYNGNFSIDTWNGQTVPYINIPENKIYNTSLNRQYSLDNQNTWTNCDGSVVTVSGGFVVGNQVWAKEPSVSGSERFLGRVASLSGGPDLKPFGKVYPGIYDSVTTDWYDYPFATGGQTFYIKYALYNLGDTAASNSNHRIRFYLSQDRIITTADTLISERTLDTLPVGTIPPANTLVFSAVAPTLTPGRYYLGMIVDATNAIIELNEDNNITTEDQVSEFIIRDPNANNGGAFKFVNSWGKGGWEEHIPDGHYWVTYDAMIAHKMAIFYYYNTFNPIYKPTVVAVFQISGSLHKSDAKIILGLGSPSSPFIKKEFQARSGAALLGGPSPFPPNSMTLDISEFAQYINDFNLFLRVENQSSATGTLSNFQVEFYSDYDTAAFKTIANTGGTNINANTTTDFTITTLNSLTSAQIPQIQPNARVVAAGNPMNEDKPTEAELAHDMSVAGVSNPYDTPAARSGPFGTGLRMPTESEWHSVLKLRSLSATGARNTQLNQSVDLSKSNFFPPIGDQGTEGSCAAWAFGYYVHTYTMAKEQGWNLLGATWVTGGSPGHPSDMVHTFSPNFIYNQINEGVDDGSSLINAGSLLTRMGCATWENMPYDQSDWTTWPTETAFRNAARYRARESAKPYWDFREIGYFIVESDADINLLKNLIANGYCVTTGIAVRNTTAPPYPGFFTYFDNKDVIDYVSGMAQPWKLDHAQTIVGFKDGTSWHKVTPDD